ncbi:MAG: hypothetical protein ACW98F_00070 [Candidatus Hodarchaeales archaeon]|jgi:hypothetical protein
MPRPKQHFATRVIELVEELGSEEKTYNFSPIVQRYISQHSGVKCEGSFKVSDTSAYGEMSYVTFWRNSNVAVAHDGVGLAWRVGDGDHYNIYVVDNDVLQEEVFLGHQVIREDTGINNYIAGGKLDLAQDTWYDFSVKIHSNYSMIVKVWLGSISEPADDDPPGADYIILSTGAKPSPYRTQDQSTYQFGIAIPETRGGEWFYDDISISAIDPGRPFTIFQLKADPAEFIDNATISYYGYGYDETPDYGVLAYILTSGGQWEYFGTNSGTEATAVLDTEIRFTTEIIDDYIYNGYVYLGVVPSGTEGDLVLRSYYVSSENILLSGMHYGNMIDVWVESPTRIEETTAEIAISDDKIYVNSSNFSTPVQEIVQLQDAALDVIEEQYYTIITEAGSAFSIEPIEYIAFSGPYQGSSETVTITYRYYQDGTSVENLLNSSNYRNPGVDVKIKVMPPYTIVVDNLTYRGTVTVEQVQKTIKDFIYDLATKFELSDFLAYLYDNGVNYINLDTLSVKVRGYDYRNVTRTNGETTITNTYTILGKGAFYTHVNELGGVVRIA